MNPKEFLERAEKIINGPNQRLVGNISTRYRLLDDDDLKACDIVSRGVKQALNSVYGAPKYGLIDAGDFDGDIIDYCKNDAEATRNMYNAMRTTIKKVIFNDPATIIIWANGDKTIVKCGEGDIFDPEKGMAMAIAKRSLGDKGNYYETFKKWLPKKEKKKKKHAICGEKLMTLNEYCEHHKISKSTAYRMIKNGDLHARKDEKGHWVIPLSYMRSE